MTPTCRLEDVLGRAVRAHDLRLGTVTGVVFDAGRERVLGLEVAGRDGVRRFLPWVAVELVGNATAIASPLVLVDTGELDGYARLGAVVVQDPLQLAGVGVARDGAIMHAESDPRERSGRFALGELGYPNPVMARPDQATAHESGGAGRDLRVGDGVVSRLVNSESSPAPRPHARA